MADSKLQDHAGRAAVEAIHAGDIDALRRLIGENPDLVRARIDGQRTLLHVAADWPGHLPNGSAIATTLLTAGGDPDAPFTGGWHSETPLHWAASSDDVALLDALLDAGADIEAPGGSIGGGTPLDDAVAYGQWRAAHRLLERGARTRLWHVAALGLVDRVDACFVGDPAPTATEIREAFWQACHGGQRQTAEYLLARGADLNWIPGWADRTPLDMAHERGATRLAEWLRDHGARSAGEAQE